ncbi:LOW QUALITY PROTEIN: Retrovirus-related Pol polyprotein from transposon, partial [Picochlorum sp. SENEW3]
SRRGAAEVVHKVFDRGTGAGRVRVKRVWLGRRRRGRVGSGFLPVMFEIEPPGVSARRMQDLVAVFVGDHRRAGSYAGARWTVRPGVYCRGGGEERDSPVQARHRARVMSWNCAGWGKGAQAGKRKAFVRLLRRERPAVVGLQETHVGLTDRQVEVPGYYTLSAPVQDDLAGCWGMCMLVARGLHVRALDTGDANVQAVLAGEGVVVDAQCVLVNVYIPTRGAGGKETRRTQVVKRLGSLVQQWYARYGDALAVVVMGDFNCPDRGDLDELLTRGEVMLHPGPLHMTVVANQHPTRVLKCKDGVKETTLDHFMVNTPARKLFNKHATSLLSCREDLQSDHAPIVVGFRSPKAKQRQRTREEGPPSASGEEALVEGRQEAAGAGGWAGAGAGDAVESTHRVGATPLVDLDLVAAREQQIVHDPEWLHVAVVIHQDREGGQLRQGLEGAEAPPSIANPPEVFYRTAMRVLRRHGCIKDPRDRRDRSRLQDKDELGQRKRKRKRMSPPPRPKTKAKARQRGWTEATRKATEAAKRGDWEQVWKYIKKTVKKQVGSPLGVPLRDPATGQLVYDEDSKAGVLMAHFAHLAVDPHPQSREWWEQQHPLPEEGECKELDVEVSWPEVSTALARATTSKAPGLDGLPNEVLKMCKGPPTAMEPPNPMAAALLEQCQAMLDGQVSQELNTSVLVALDKPGKDAQEVGNKRGISLMPTLLKLATKIAANRIQNHTPEVAKEQAGFRPGEECLQNVAALHEVCHLRRHHWGQPTYVAFMDLKKAFDTVPHAAMLHVLHAKGVRGKIYRFIDKVYQSGSFVLQHHQQGTTTAPAPIQRGVRQGDTLSPLLFSLFIDHAMDGLEGVEVPDRQGRTVGHMRGLLVADDAVLLAPHAEGIQAALAKFQTWCDTYHMQVGHDKCGLMVPLPEFQHLQAQAKEAPDQFMCQGQPIPVVDQYTYLGLQIDLNLSTDTLRKGRLEAGEQALRALAPMLANARVPLALKAVCIKGLLLPTLTYGAEIWGAGPCQDHTDIHTIYSDAMQLAIVGTRKAKATYRRDSATIELGLPSIQAAITTAPTRAIRKWTQSKTWIQDLLLHHDHRQILEAAVTALHTPPPHATDTSPEAQVITTCQRAKSTVAVPYQYCLATATALLKQGLKSGTREGIFITPLIRARLNGYGNLLYRQRHFAPAVQTNLRINGIKSDHYCCSCKTQTKDTLHHLGMECTAYAELRNTYLNSMLDHFRALLNVEGIMDTDEDLWMLCLGGTGLIADKYCNNDLFTELTKYWLYADPETPSPPPPENEIEPPSPAPPPYQQTAAFIKSVMTRHTRAIDKFLRRHERKTTKKTPPPRQPSSSRSEREGPSHAAGHGSQKPETTLKQSKITSLWRRALAP